MTNEELQQQGITERPIPTVVTVGWSIRLATIAKWFRKRRKVEEELAPTEDNADTTKGIWTDQIKRKLMDEFSKSLNRTFSEIQMQSEKETGLLRVMMVSGKPKMEVIAFMESQILSYDDVAKFYSRFARFPISEESEFINEIGIINFMSFANVEVKISL